MTEPQSGLWDRMIQHLRDYDHRSLSFHGLVYHLKKTVEVVELEEGEFLRGWRGVWNPLAEIVRQNPAADVDPMEVQPRVEHLRTFLIFGKSKYSPKNPFAQP